MPTPTSKSQTRIATFKVPQADYEQVEAVAEREERSVSAVLRLAVRAYLDARREQAA